MPDDPKLAEFRENNIKLTKQNEDLTKQVADLQTQLAAVDTNALATMKTTLSTRETELATEKTAHAETKKRAEAYAIDQKLTDAFLKVGGRPEARRTILLEAAGQFTVDDTGELRGVRHSPSRPGELMSVNEWLTLQLRQNAYCFLPSAGAGANPSSGNGGTSGARVIKNPTPQDLGRYAAEIAKGTVRLEYDR